MALRILLAITAFVIICSRGFCATLHVGEAEDFASPHEAVAAAGNGDTILINEGTYEFSDALSLSELEGVTIIGRGDVQLMCDNMEDNVFWITGCRGITIRNVRAKHTDPSKDERCYGNVFGIDSSKDIIIANCEIHGCGAIGVYVYNSYGVELKDNHIHDNSFWAVQFEGEGLLGEDHSIDGLTMEGNILENNGCREGVVYEEGFTIASFIGVVDADNIYFLFRSEENGDTIRFLVPESCEECIEILNDPHGYGHETMEIEWSEVGMIMPGEERCIRMRRIESILVLP